nr:AgmX/PglI C-terminal domain-containing protein [Aliikangiella sp. G2MR2-5]
MKGNGADLADHSTTEVAGVVGDGVSDGLVEGKRTFRTGLRDKESIKLTLEKNKGPIYLLYYQALELNPEANGKFVFRFVIEPDGKVTNLKLVASELEMNQLEQKILNLIEKIDFGAKEVSPTPTDYTFTFFPLG